MIDCTIWNHARFIVFVVVAAAATVVLVQKAINACDNKHVFFECQFCSFFLFLEHVCSLFSTNHVFSGLFVVEGDTHRAEGLWEERYRKTTLTSRRTYNTKQYRNNGG